MLSVINIFLNFCVRGIKSSKAERAEFIRKTLIWPYLGRKWPKIRVYLTYRHVWKLQIDHVKLAGCSQICRVMPKGQILSKFVVNVHVCVSGDKKCSFFGKFDVLFFSWNTRFETRPFALLPTNCQYLCNELRDFANFCRQ